MLQSMSPFFLIPFPYKYNSMQISCASYVHIKYSALWLTLSGLHNPSHTNACLWKLTLRRANSLSRCFLTEVSMSFFCSIISCCNLDLFPSEFFSSASCSFVASLTICWLLSLDVRSTLKMSNFSFRTMSLRFDNYEINNK